MALEEFDHRKGRCINCGFLGKRVNRDVISDCYEATVHDRESGDLIHGFGHSTFAWCFVRKISIGDEIGGNHADFAKVLKFIQDDRRCSSWCQWIEFLTPKEHLFERSRKSSDCMMQRLTGALVLFAVVQLIVLILQVIRTP